MKVAINGVEYVPAPFRPEAPLPIHKLCRYYGIDLETLADSVDTHGIPNATPRTPSKRKTARMGGRA